MQKIEYISSFYNTILFFCSRRCQIKLAHYLTMKIHNKRELQNIAINHSADIDYNDFLKIYRKCTKEPYFFFDIDTTLPVDNCLKFRKNLLDSL